MRRSDQERHEGSRWASRPYLSALLRGFVFLSPMVASFLVAITVARAVPRPTGGAATAVWWGSVLLSSFAALFAVERLVRRLTPLAVLLKFTLTFPDKAPSRYRVARRSGDIEELRKTLNSAKQKDDKQGLDEVAETILSLATALSTHDRQTRGHSERVRVFTDMLAEELKVPAAERNRLRWAALLHDIGKLEVPAKILNKPGPLDDHEWSIIKQHPHTALRFIGPLAGWLGPHAETIRHHHERYDGTGYPDGVGGGQISLGARIVAVADSYDTMTASRPYKKPLTAAGARQELSRCAGTQFDPRIVRAMMNISLGSLWWRVGVFSWLAQMPIIGPVSQLLSRTLETAFVAVRTAAAAGALGVAAASTPLVADHVRQDPPATVATSSEVAGAQADSMSNGGAGQDDADPDKARGSKDEEAEQQSDADTAEEPSEAAASDTGSSDAGSTTPGGSSGGGSGAGSGSSGSGGGSGGSGSGGGDSGSGSDGSGSGGGPPAADPPGGGGSGGGPPAGDPPGGGGSGGGPPGGGGGPPGGGSGGGPPGGGGP